MVINLFIYLSLIFLNWEENTIQSFPYHMDKPDKVYELPQELNEISGIADIGDNKIACITDELGTIFIYDLKSEKITERHPFGGKGDYEDIVYHSNTYYILQSNGDITQLTGKDSKILGSELSKINNTEGLCYDKSNHRLLIASKAAPFNIYSYNLNKNELEKNPAVLLKEKKFNSSGITFLNDDELLILSGNSKLGIYSISKKTIKVIPLQKKWFNQPEGITKMNNGDLLISNEAGKKGKATILQFH